MKPLFLLIALVLCAPAFAARQSFPPQDEAVNDPELEAFRADLLARVAARDIEAVVAASCPDIYLSHGGSGGPRELRANLEPTSQTMADSTSPQANTSREEYWTALQETLSQPGFFDSEGEFWMPHQWKLTLPASLDPLEVYFVTGQNVALRNEPSPAGAVLDQISYEVVIIRDYQGDKDYQLVRLTDGVSGYMHRDYLWSMIGYRAALVKSESGDWQLCTFVAGD